MAKKKWPKINRTGKPVQAFLSEETLARLQQLAEQTGRPLAEEVRHAIERHLAQPPRVVVEPLAEATVGQPARQPSKAPAGAQEATRQDEMGDGSTKRRTRKARL
jgi:hypothetical protein